MTGHIVILSVDGAGVRVVKPKCPECGRVFDLLNETDAAEWAYGHDCES